MQEFREKYINPFTDYGFKRLFALKNSHKLDRIPEKLKENIFLKLFKTAEIAKFSQKEYQYYEDSLKYYRDLNNSLDTAKEEKAIEIAKNLISNGVDIKIVAKSTGLSITEIEKLKQ